MKQYGLDPARIEVTFKPAAARSSKLLLGQKTPTGVRHLRQGAGQAARVPGRVLPRVDVQQVQLRSARQDDPEDRSRQGRRAWRSTLPDRTLEVRQAGGRLADDRSRSTARADFGAVEGIIGRLNTTPMKAIVAARRRDRRRCRNTASTSRPRRCASRRAARRPALAIGKSRGRRRRLCEGPVAADGVHRRVGARSTS